MPRERIFDEAEYGRRVARTKERMRDEELDALVVGDPSAKLERTAEVVVEGVEAALDAAEPGVTCESVERAWRETIAQYDIEKEDRIGYSMGLGYPPDWGEHTASLRPGDETVLEEDMTFHMIPGLWTDKIGVEISETFHVTSNGAETLAEFPRRLFRT